MYASAAVIDELKHDPDRVVAFYYFDFRDGAKQGAHGLLCSLALQLGNASHECASHLRVFHARNVNGKPSIPLLMELLRDLVSILAKPIFFVLDAIDECPLDTRRTEVLSCLEALLLPSPVQLHVLFSSRPEIDIRESFDQWRSKRCTEEIDVHNVESHSQDMESYIKHVLSSDSTFRNWPPHLVELAQTTLHEKANGM